MKQIAYQQFILPILEEVFPKREAYSIYKYVFEEYFNSKFIQLTNSTLDELALEDLNTIFGKISNHYPIQYIFNKAYFYGLSLYVDENVLIPRPETEELVHLILQQNTNANLRILDIGTGSGCIPIAFKKHRPNWQIDAIDVSQEALLVAKRNADENKVEINFIEQDICNTNIFCDKKYDIIVSNPPYIIEQEKPLMTESTLTFEPETALFVPNNDALYFYRLIGKFALNHLEKNGKLYFELNEFFADETKALIQQLGFNQVQMIKDLQEKNRILLAY